ncbi:hypothetical protein, partial [Escherichia coli]|uniref:hypothetical protein n=1 Tax=Escherichia coli TaxID=562 RepID=UPI0015E5BA4A
GQSDSVDEKGWTEAGFKLAQCLRVLQESAPIEFVRMGKKQVVILPEFSLLAPTGELELGRVAGFLLQALERS